MRISDWSSDVCSSDLPDKLAQYNLTPGDVAAAVREQNAQFAAGRFGDTPSDPSTPFTYSATTHGRLPDAEAFGNLHLRASEDAADRKSVGEGKSVSVRGDLGWRRILTKKKKQR